MPVNKVNYGNQTIIDLTDSTLSDASQLVSGITAYDRSGTKITGTYQGSEWTSGIYMDEDGYIRVSPLAGAGGVYYDGGYIYFGEEQYSELPNGDDVGYGLNEPHLISLNGHWKYDNNDTVDVTEGNHIIYVSNLNYGSGGNRIITRSDGRPWFGFNPGKAEIIIKPDIGSLAANGRIALYADVNDVDPYWNFGPGYNTATTYSSTKTISEPILIYGIGIRRYWAGTTDIYIEIYCEGERIV